MNYTYIVNSNPSYIRTIGYVLAIISMLVAVVYKIHHRTISRIYVT
jgi:hypothetical protein